MIHFRRFGGSGKKLLCLFCGAEKRVLRRLCGAKKGGSSPLWRLRNGGKHAADWNKTEERTARAMGSGELPVFATPAVVALAEEAAWKSVAGELEKGQGSVGTEMRISHISATPQGMKVWCETELVEIDKRKLVFSFTAYDESGKIAEGIHVRFVVDNSRFLLKAEQKRQQ